MRGVLGFRLLRAPAVCPDFRGPQQAPAGPQNDPYRLFVQNERETGHERRCLLSDKAFPEQDAGQTPCLATHYSATLYLATLWGSCYSDTFRAVSS